MTVFFVCVFLSLRFCVHIYVYVCTLYVHTGRSTQHIKADLTEKGDLGVVAEVRYVTS